MSVAVMTQSLVQADLTLIDTPDGWRIVPDDAVADLAEAMALEGLLQPIGLWPQPDGRYRLIYGKTRLMAARRLGWETIRAQPYDLANDEQRELLTGMENVVRTEANETEKDIYWARFAREYQAANPGATLTGATRRNAEQAEASGGPPAPPKVDSADAVIAKKTGKSRSAVRKKLRLVDRIGEAAYRQFKVVLGLSNRQLGQLNAIEDDAKFHRTAKWISNEQHSFDVAIRHSDLPVGAVIEEPAPQVEDEGPGDDRLTDQEWIDKNCEDVLKRLKYPIAFRRDATLYRKTTAIRQALKNASKTPISAAKVQENGPFAVLFMQFNSVEHPRHWLACGKCQGNGMLGSKGKCDDCHGKAFLLTYTSQRLSQGGR